MCIADLTLEASRTPTTPKVITQVQRIEALGLARANEDRAALCSKEQNALAELFRINARTLRELVS